MLLDNFDEAICLRQVVFLFCRKVRKKVLGVNRNVEEACFLFV